MRSTRRSRACEALPAPPRHPALAAIAAYRHWLDALDDAYPALEWGLRWCELHAPAAFDVTLIHRDYRTGNYLVDDGRLTGVLDWEFAGWGDPREDLGWFTARCWRFGGPDREAGGIAPLEPFIDGYESVADRTHFAARSRLLAGDGAPALGHHRAAAGAAPPRGGERSLELALTGRIVHELEYEVLRLIEQGGRMTTTGIDDAADLLTTAREALLADLSASAARRAPLHGTDDRQRDGHRRARIRTRQGRGRSRSGAIARTCGRRRITRRTRDPRTFPRFGAQVTAAIRDGRFDDSAHAEALTRALLQVAADRVAISNPKALAPIAMELTLGGKSALVTGANGGLGSHFAHDARESRRQRRDRGAPARFAARRR